MVIPTLAHGKGRGGVSLTEIVPGEYNTHNVFIDNGLGLTSDIGK